MAIDQGALAGQAIGLLEQGKPAAAVRALTEEAKVAGFDNAPRGITGFVPGVTSGWQAMASLWQKRTRGPALWAKPPNLEEPGDRS